MTHAETFLDESRSTITAQVVDARSKWGAFEGLLDPYKPGGKRVIVSSNTKRDVNRIAQNCGEPLGNCVDTISGDINQKQRESVIRRFREGEVTMVIATD